jgi:ABC-type xylose transport system permease subunit
MIKIIKYFFYRLYSRRLANGENDPIWSIGIVSIFGILNVYGILGVVQILFHSQTPQIPKWIVFVLGLLLFYGYYWLLTKNGKAKEIVEEFDKMQGNRMILNLALFLYITVSIVLFIYTGNVVRNMNH